MSPVPGTAHYPFDTIDSTNAEALRRLAAGDEGPFWVTATHQTAGRGRRGRDWAAPLGNFAGTYGVRLAADPAAAALRSFAAALAVADALDALGVPRDGIALKWPNDVLLDGRKLSGILLESVALPSPTTGTSLAVGIGINLAAAPPAGAVEPGVFPPIALSAVGVTASPDEFFAHLAPAMAAWDAVLSAQGFRPLRDAWLSRAARLGETVTARLQDTTLTGRFETVDETGALVLDTPTGRRHLPAADVYF